MANISSTFHPATDIPEKMQDMAIIPARLVTREKKKTQTPDKIIEAAIS